VVVESKKLRTVDLFLKSGRPKSSLMAELSGWLSWAEERKRKKKVESLEDRSVKYPPRTHTTTTTLQHWRVVRSAVALEVGNYLSSTPPQMATTSP
jgi:hypothetical protein